MYIGSFVLIHGLALKKLSIKPTQNSASNKPIYPYIKEMSLLYRRLLNLKKRLLNLTNEFEQKKSLLHTKLYKKGTLYH